MKNDIIMMGHGGGGAMTGSLINGLIMRELGNPILEKLDDSACIEMPGEGLVFTTDSYVIDPIFFPGGDIGMLSVCGTANDLAMQGAEPRYMSLGLIIQEGFSMSDLEKIISSIGETARSAGVAIVTGDTKVIENRGDKGGIFINTSGVGAGRPGVDVSASNAKEGDMIIVSGTLGDHGIAVMNEREGLGLKSGLASDVAVLWPMVNALLEAVPDIHCLRDPTRGGLAAALCDIATKSGCSIRIREHDLPIRDEVRGVCGLLGLDPLNVANEGKAVIVCPGDKADKALGILRDSVTGKDACAVGEVVSGGIGRVVMKTCAGGERIVDVLAGLDLPRIC